MTVAAELVGMDYLEISPSNTTTGNIISVYKSLINLFKIAAMIVSAQTYSMRLNFTLIFRFTVNQKVCLYTLW